MRNTFQMDTVVKKVAQALFLIPFLIWGVVGCSKTEPQDVQEKIRFVFVEEADSAPGGREELVVRMRQLGVSERQEEIHWLALNMYHEARGEGFDGWIAVGHVTLNRVRSARYPDTVQAVVTQQNARGCQFSWYCDGRSDAVRPGDESLFELMLTLSEELLLLDAYEDTTYGSLHYYNPWKANPNWAWGKIPSVRIGSHLFFNNIS